MVNGYWVTRLVKIARYIVVLVFGYDLVKHSVTRTSRVG